MARFRRDEGGMDAVVGTLLIVAIVVLLVAGVFLFLNGFHSAVERKTVLYGLVTEDADQAADRWSIRLQSVNHAEPPGAFDWVLATPQNGTLVARPAAGVSMPFDLFWELGPGAGAGVHRDNGSVVQTAGFGGYRLFVADNDGNGVLSVGDRFIYGYDGDGDQGHTLGRDDRFPTGTYGFDLVHRATQSIAGTVQRDV